jgi:hypothetical protein
MPMVYLQVLEAHGWVQVPTTLNTSITFFAHGEHLLDRVQVSRGCWSHYQFDGTSWLTDAKARGDDAASLDAYLRKHYRSVGR